MSRFSKAHTLHTHSTKIETALDMGTSEILWPPGRLFLPCSCTFCHFLIPLQEQVDCVPVLRLQYLQSLLLICSEEIRLASVIVNIIIIMKCPRARVNGLWLSDICRWLSIFVYVIPFYLCHSLLLNLCFPVKFKLCQSHASPARDHGLVFVWGATLKKKTATLNRINPHHF